MYSNLFGLTDCNGISSLNNIWPDEMICTRNEIGSKLMYEYNIWLFATFFSFIGIYILFVLINIIIWTTIM